MTDTEQEIAAQMTDDDDGTSDDEQAEQEQGDGLAPEPEPEDAAPPPRSQKEIDELHDKLKKEGERHAKRVAEIMGDDFSLLVPSPIDWTPGYLFNVPGMLPAPSQVAALHEIMGEAPNADYSEAPDAEPCGECNALGQTLTGSKVPGQEVKPCRKCNGSGWTPKLDLPPPMPNVTQFPTQPGATDAAPNQFPVADRWGRPQGHPHYNMEPAFVGA